MNRLLKVTGALLFVYVAYIFWDAPERLDGGKYLEYYIITSDDDYKLNLKEKVKIPEIVKLRYILNYNPNSKNSKMFNEIEEWDSRVTETYVMGATTEYSNDQDLIIVTKGLDSESNLYEFVTFEPANLRLNQFLDFNIISNIEFPDGKFWIRIVQESGETNMNIEMENKLIVSISYFTL